MADAEEDDHEHDDHGDGLFIARHWPEFAFLIHSTEQSISTEEPCKKEK